MKFVSLKRILRFELCVVIGPDRMTSNEIQIAFNRRYYRNSSTQFLECLDLLVD